MRIRLSPVARLLAAVLLVQVVLAPAHCLSRVAPPAGVETVICAAEGVRTIHIGADGRELPAHAPDEGFCPGCHGLPQMAMPAAPALPTPAWLAAGPAWHASAPEALPSPARGPPFGPRAPPLLG